MVLKNLLENYPKDFSAQRSSPALKKLCCKRYKVIEAPWGATPPRFPLFFYPTWPRCGFSARLPRFLLDIGPSFGLCPLKVRGPSQAKWTKASSVLIWRTMVKSIHDSRPSIWTSPHNRLRSQIPLSSFSIVFCTFKRDKNHNSCLSSLIRFVNRLPWQNRLLRHKTAFHDKLKKIAFHGI